MAASALLDRPAGKLAKCRLIATQFSNSAYHGAALDRNHIGTELRRFLTTVEVDHPSITLEALSAYGVYLSHETQTHASPESSCAYNEIDALREVFGSELLAKFTILNTKGFTGHPMGVSFEDVVAVQCLVEKRIPPVVSLKHGSGENFVRDRHLGDLRLSEGGRKDDVKYALRFAAGFGSQVAFALYAL
jgi:3-oxoacyl-(acyl-carrier-protein) synthase